MIQDSITIIKCFLMALKVKHSCPINLELCTGLNFNWVPLQVKSIFKTRVYTQVCFQTQIRHRREIDQALKREMSVLIQPIDKGQKSIMD